MRFIAWFVLIFILGLVCGLTIKNRGEKETNRRFYKLGVNQVWGMVKVNPNISIYDKKEIYFKIDM